MTRPYLGHAVACSALMVFCASAGGCATRISVLRPPSAAQETEVNEIVANETLTLTIDDGRKLVCKDVRLAGSSVRFSQLHPDTSLWEPSPLFETATSLASVRRIEISNRGRGALQGLGIGVGVGAALGASVGAIWEAAIGKECREYCGLALVMSTIGGAIIGFLIGPAVGAIADAPTIIEFHEKPTEIGPGSGRSPCPPPPLGLTLTKGVGERCSWDEECKPPAEDRQGWPRRGPRPHLPPPLQGAGEASRGAAPGSSVAPLPGLAARSAGASPSRER